MSNRYVIAVPVTGFRFYEVTADSPEEAIARYREHGDVCDEELEEVEPARVEERLA